MTKRFAVKGNARAPAGHKPVQTRKADGSWEPRSRKNSRRLEWTSELPSKPGFYWFRGLAGRTKDRIAGEIVRVLPTTISENIPGNVIVPGRNNRYGLHSCRGDWAGPVNPPVESNDPMS